MMDSEHARVYGEDQPSGMTLMHGVQVMSGGPSHVYDRISLDGSSHAIFGNVDRSTHHHHYALPAQDALPGKRPRDDGDDTNLARSKTAKVDHAHRLIEALSFDTMWERHGQIADAHPGTCEWALSTPEREPTPSSDEEDYGQSATPSSDEEDYGQSDTTETRTQKLSFSRWLESDSDYFWICGTAGSGKSTLMSYIINHEADIRTRLGVWAGTQELIFASYFFWRHGKFLQKSINGMVRTLLVQVLQQTPGVAEILVNSVAASQKALLTGTGNRSECPWSQATLTHLSHQAIKNCDRKICFFIDALDEFHAYDTKDQLDPHDAALRESTQALLACIRTLWCMPHVKVCVASRPGNLFTVAFGTTETLQLQALNEADISLYASGNLEQLASKKVAQDISKILLEKSCGIFIWVKLAVDSIIQGDADGNDPADLMRRLDELPAGLEAMYIHMLKKLDVRYRNDAALIFRLKRRFDGLLDGYTPNGLPIFLARNAYNATANNEVPSITPDYMTRILNSRTCGLLTATRDASFLRCMWRNQFLPESTTHAAALHITYIHRTAEEFFEQHMRGIGHGEICCSEFSEPQHILYVKSIIEGLFKFLELIRPEQQSTYHNEPFGFAGGWYNKVASYELYNDVLDVLRRIKGVHLDYCYQCLDRLSALQLPLANPRLFELFNINESHLKEYYSPRELLSHLSRFADYGFAEYALKHIAGSDLDRVAEVSYLLYFVLWQKKNRVSMEDDEREEWIIRLQNIIMTFEKGQNYLWNVWRIFLIARSTLPPNCLQGRYRSLLRAFKIASIRNLGPYRLFFDTFNLEFYNSEHEWELMIDLGLLLHPEIHHRGRNGTWTDDSSILACMAHYEKILPVQEWPRQANLVRYHDNWIKLESSINSEQSHYIFHGDHAARFLVESPTCNSNYTTHSRLRWLALYELATLSGTLSPDLSWGEYTRRVDLVPLESFFADIDAAITFATYIEPCVVGSCWSCLCVESCEPSPECKNCPCAKRLGIWGNRSLRHNKQCPSWCGGCNCPRSLNNTWLREVLREDELDWDNWYDILIDKYGLRETTFVEDMSAMLDDFLA